MPKSKSSFVPTHTRANSLVPVYSAPRDRVHINPMQRRLARTPETNCKGEFAGVFRPVMLGGAVGLGQTSCVSTLRSPVKPSGGLSRPGHRRRGHCHRPKNPAFANTFPTKQQEDAVLMEAAFECLRQDHLHLTSPAKEDRYEQMREAFLMDWPTQEKRLNAMEEAHNRSMK
jgi:hypothetical protein